MVFDIKQKSCINTFVLTKQIVSAYSKNHRMPKKKTEYVF